MDITIFGTGYVGLVTGACLADVGHHVTCVDVDEKKIAALRGGAIPIFEPGLEEIVARNAGENRLFFTTAAGQAIEKAELIFIAVGTPPGEDGSADLTHVLSVARTVGKHLNGFKVVVNKSTVPVGTADKVAEAIRAILEERGAAIAFDVCSNPEFLKEGSAIEDFNKPARIVVGSDSEEARRLMRECYAPYNRNHDKMMLMDVRSAELTKYAANAMLAAKISFMNEVAAMAERLGADIEAVRQGIGSDPRIGYHFIYPGCGYGGSCFPKDVRALAKTAEAAGVEASLLRAIEAVNERQKTVLFDKLDRIFEGALSGRTIALWGLAFKPRTDDMRDAPSRTLMEALWARGARVQAFDPEAMEVTRALYGERADLVFAASREDAAKGADALVICTEWKQFRVADFAWLKQTLKHPVIVDGRNLYDPAEVRAHGLSYYAIGRGDSAQLHGAAAEGKPAGIKLAS